MSIYYRLSPLRSWPAFVMTLAICALAKTILVVQEQQENLHPGKGRIWLNIILIGLCLVLAVWGWTRSDKLYRPMFLVAGIIAVVAAVLLAIGLL
jgi:hypothetical protein